MANNIQEGRADQLNYMGNLYAIPSCELMWSSSDTQYYHRETHCAKHITQLMCVCRLLIRLLRRKKTVIGQKESHPNSLLYDQPFNQTACK